MSIHYHYWTPLTWLIPSWPFLEQPARSSAGYVEPVTRTRLKTLNLSQKLNMRACVLSDRVIEQCERCFVYSALPQGRNFGSSAPRVGSRAGVFGLFLNTYSLWVEWKQSDCSPPSANISLCQHPVPYRLIKRDEMIRVSCIYTPAIQLFHLVVVGCLQRTKRSDVTGPELVGGARRENIKNYVYKAKP
jgi:hypothetical protein